MIMWLRHLISRKIFNSFQIIKRLFICQLTFILCDGVNFMEPWNDTVWKIEITGVLAHVNGDFKILVAAFVCIWMSGAWNQFQQSHYINKWKYLINWMHKYILILHYIKRDVNGLSGINERGEYNSKYSLFWQNHII